MADATLSADYLFSAIKALERRAAALQEVAQFVRSTDEVEALLFQILAKVADLAGAEAAGLALPDRATGKLQFIIASAGARTFEDAKKDKAVKAVRLGADNGLIAGVMASGDPIVSAPAAELESLRKEMGDLPQGQVRNLLAVPLAAGDVRLGVLALFNKKPQGIDFSPEDLDFASSLSFQIALVLEAYRLRSQGTVPAKPSAPPEELEALRRREEDARSEILRLKAEVETLKKAQPAKTPADEERDDEQVRRLTLLLKSLEIVNSKMSMEDVLDGLIAIGMQLMNAEASSILLMDEELGQLYFAAATGAKREEVKRVYLGKGEGIAGWVAQNGELLVVQSVAEDPRFSKKVDEISGFVTRSILAAPIRADGKLVGVAEIINKRDPAGFSHADADMLSNICSYGAMAIQKARLYKDMDELFWSTLRALVDAFEAKDAGTRGRCDRTRRLAVALAEEMKIPEKDKKDVEIAALLHDIGKIGVPDQILNKQENLTDDEYSAVMKVPIIGAEILSSIKQLRGAVPLVRHVNERWDGKGYPDKLTGDKIPLGSRLIAVAVTFEAMTSDRPYRRGLPEDVALKELSTCAAVQFDPACVEAFVRIYRKGKIKNLLRE